VAPLKGLAYATSLYPAPELRPMTDIDLLVLPHAQSRVAAIVENCGFSRVTRAYQHHATAWSRDGQVVDIHTSIIAPGRSRIDLEAVWSRTAPDTVFDGAERLDAVDAYVFHLVHMARDRLRGPMMHIIDAAWLRERVPSAMRGETLDRARAWGLESAVTIADRFSTRVLEGDLTRSHWIEPSLGDVAVFAEPTLAGKVAFDLVAAGSSSQVAMRAVQAVANRLWQAFRIPR